MWEEEVPPADYVVMCSSFMLFQAHEQAIFSKLFSAARQALIISEPVRNYSSHPVRWLGRLFTYLTNPGIGEFHYRYNVESFNRFADENGASEFISSPPHPLALTVFQKKPLRSD